MGLIVVAGALANKPRNGGAAWTRLSWALGLKRLGHEVYFIEQIAPETCVDSRGASSDLESSMNVAFFREVTELFGLSGASALISEVDGRTIGVCETELAEIADAADSDVAWLRRIHVELDEAVMEAYGWTDLPLDHGFNTYRQMRRWTVSPTARVEILDRLLEENHRRAAAQGEAPSSPEGDVEIEGDEE